MSEMEEDGEALEKEEQEIFDYWYQEEYLTGGGKPIESMESRWSELEETFYDWRWAMHATIEADKQKREKAYRRSFEFWYNNVYSGKPPTEGKPEDDEKICHAYEAWDEIGENHFYDDLSEEDRQGYDDLLENME